MDYKSAEYDGKDLRLINIKYFDPEQTLVCGQCFRWAVSNGIYSGIALGKRLDLFLEGNDLVFKNTSPDEFESLWKKYFDLERSYDKLHQFFAKDKILKEALAFSQGLRLVQQEPWETLITFILSQNTNIPRITGMISRLCEGFGNPLPDRGFSFPSPQTLTPLSPEDLAPVRCGYRAQYIIDAAKQVTDGATDLVLLRAMPAEKAFRELQQLNGVGPKVAECVLLYGYGRTDRFPLDVWIKRVMAEYYPTGFPKEFSSLAGIAQLFLFRYIRMKN